MACVKWRLIRSSQWKLTESPSTCISLINALERLAFQEMIMLLLIEAKQTNDFKFNNQRVRSKGFGQKFGVVVSFTSALLRDKFMRL